jgi:phosphatidylserine/phosphatidylglycerophosphate/cardiolipin synthase-like enzyme
MAKFLSTSATSYYLEELIKSAKERLIIISPYLKFNERIKELLEDKNRIKMDIRIVYGKTELKPEEITWLRSLSYVRTSFLDNLHAKCYINEENAIITSMNLYDFSQVNNNEMGVFIQRQSEPELYKDTLEEAQRLFRSGNEIRVTVEKVIQKETTHEYKKLTTANLAKDHGIKTEDMFKILIEKGYLTYDGKQHKLTGNGKKAGGELHTNKQNVPYFLWPKDISLIEIL